MDIRLKFEKNIGHNAISRYFFAFVILFISLNTPTLSKQFYKNQLWLMWAHALSDADATKSFLEWESALTHVELVILQDKIRQSILFGGTPDASRISGYLYFLENKQQLTLEAWANGNLLSSELIAWGQLAMQLEAYSYAERWLGYATLYDDALSTPWYLLGKIYIYQASWSKAMTAFEKAVQNNNFTVIDTKISDVYWELGNLYRDYRTPKDWASILQTYDTALTANQFSSSWSEAQAHFLLGYGKWQTNDPLNAITYMEEAINIHPVHYQAHVWLGIAYLETYQDAQKAEILWQSAVRIDDQNTRAFQLLGDLYSQQEIWNQAVDMYSEILKIEPENSYAQNQLATIKGN